MLRGETATQFRARVIALSERIKQRNIDYNVATKQPFSILLSESPDQLTQRRSKLRTIMLEGPPCDCYFCNETAQGVVEEAGRRNITITVPQAKKAFMKWAVPAIPEEWNLSGHLARLQGLRSTLGFFPEFRTRIIKRAQRVKIK